MILICRRYLSCPVLLQGAPGNYASRWKCFGLPGYKKSTGGTRNFLQLHFPRMGPTRKTWLPWLKFLPGTNQSTTGTTQIVNFKWSQDGLHQIKKKRRILFKVSCFLNLKSSLLLSVDLGLQLAPVLFLRHQFFSFALDPKNSLFKCGLFQADGRLIPVILWSIGYLVAWLPQKKSTTRFDV